MIYSVLIYGLCGGSLFLLSLLLLANLPKVNKKANLFLGISSFFLACIFIQVLLESVNLHEGTILFFFMELGRWAIFPSLFVAVNLYISPEKTSRQYLIHFVPTLFLLFLLLGSYTLPSFLVYGIRYFLYFQLLLYSCWSYLLLRKHRRRVEQFSSHVSEIDLAWLVKLLWAIFLLGILSVVVRLFPWLSFVIDCLYLIVILYFSYYALLQKAIYPVADEEVPIIKQTSSSKDKERLTTEQVRIFEEKLLRLIEEEKPYLDPMVSLPTLAEQTGLSLHELSYVLNAGVGLNFYQFINGYRIRYAIHLLEEMASNGYTIHEVSIRSGFNSKTTFYTSFKQVIGMTPKQYLQQHKQ